MGDINISNVKGDIIASLDGSRITKISSQKGDDKPIWADKKWLIGIILTVIGLIIAYVALTSNTANVSQEPAGATPEQVFKPSVNGGAIYLVKANNASGDEIGFTFVLNTSFENEGSKTGKINNIEIKLISPDLTETHFITVFEADIQKIVENCTNYYKQDYISFNLMPNESKNLALQFMSKGEFPKFIEGKYVFDVFINGEKKYSNYFMLNEGNIIDWAHGHALKIDLDTHLQTRFGSNGPLMEPKIC